MADHHNVVGADAVVFLTGATGFVGKVVLDLLLCCRSVKCVYLLIRDDGRSGSSSTERCTKLVASSGLERGRERLRSGGVSIVPVAGDLSSTAPCLGIAKTHITMLASTCTHVIHCGACTSFDLPLVDAARINIGGSLGVLELASRCEALRCLVYCSSAYALPPSRAPLDEELPRVAPGSPLSDPEALAAQLLRGEASAGSGGAAVDWRASGHPNTYSFSKCAAELLLAAKRGRVPLHIVRPSIIGAASSYPSAGWLESQSGVAALALLMRLGAMHTTTGHPATPLDVVPVDLVARMLVDAALLSPPAPAPPPSLAGVAPPAPLRIWHAVAGLPRCVAVSEVVDTLQAAFGRNVHGPAGRVHMRTIAPIGSSRRLLSRAADVGLLLIREWLLARLLAWLLHGALCLLGATLGGAACLAVAMSLDAPVRSVRMGLAFGCGALGGASALLAAAMPWRDRLDALARRLRRLRLKLVHADGLFAHFTSVTYDFRTHAESPRGIPFDRLECIAMLGRAVDRNVAQALERGPQPRSSPPSAVTAGGVTDLKPPPPPQQQQPAAAYAHWVLTRALGVARSGAGASLAIYLLICAIAMCAIAAGVLVASCTQPAVAVRVAVGGHLNENA
jgi:thioester reductase-like protein